MFYSIIAFLVIFFLVAVISSLGDADKALKWLEDFRAQVGEPIPTSTYICGHPSIDQSISNTFIVIGTDTLLIYFGYRLSSEWRGAGPGMMGTIPLKDIEDVQVEDATTIEHRMTVARIALTGLFAFALKKKEVKELAYLTIKWRQGKFLHETIFEFYKDTRSQSPVSAITKANGVRNRIIAASSTL